MNAARREGSGRRLTLCARGAGALPGPGEYLLTLQTNATNEDVGFQLRVTLRSLPVSGSPVDVVTQPGTERVGGGRRDPEGPQLIQNENARRAGRAGTDGTGGDGRDGREGGERRLRWPAEQALGA